MSDSYRDVTPDDVLDFHAPTNSFLCPLSANQYEIEFLSFEIKDYESKKLIFAVGRDNPPPMDFDIDPNDENSFRRIKYDFSEDVLRLPTISTNLMFRVGDRPVNNFRMIERHYFRDQMVKSYDFTFGFCIPGSTNTWEAIYDIPPLDEDLIQEMMSNPHATVSDSFYFVGDRLIMHNKASYKYIPEDRAQAKRSYDNRYGNAAKLADAGSGGAAKAAAKSSKLDYDDTDGFHEDDYDDTSGEPAARSDSKTGADGLGTPSRGSKASSKLGDDDIAWSKETDYY